MSKRLEEEYKNMVAAEVPDLWDRIEKSLPEKAPVEEKKTSETAAEPVKKNKKKKPVIVRILPWAGGIAAAALIALILLPVAFFGNKTKNATATLETNAVQGIQGLTDTVKCEAAPESVEAEEDALEETQGVSNEEPADNGKVMEQAGQAVPTDGQKKQYAVPEREKLCEGKEEEIIYVQILSTDSTTGKVTIAAVLDLEDLKNPDPSLEIETCRIKVAKESKEDVKVKGIYKATITEDGEVLLLECIE